MDIIRGGQQRHSRPSVMASTAVPVQAAQRSHDGYGLNPRQLLIPAILLAVFLALLIIFALLPSWLSGQKINTEGYQTVVLTNGQAYFGKLQNTDGQYLVLKTPYTTQVSNGAQQNGNNGTQLQIIQVKDQVYGAEDSMAIRADQVALWQNLRDDSKVVQAIKGKQ